MILHDSSVLRILTTVRDQLQGLRAQVPVGCVAIGEDFADALDIFDDAIADELRAVRESSVLARAP